MRRIPLGPSLLVIAAALVALPIACAEPVDTGDGGGQGGAGGGGAGGSGGEGGSMGPCIYAEDCVSFTDSCNVGACVNGACQKLPSNDGTDCDDGKECSIGDKCQQGLCTGTSEKPCPPMGGPCSVGKCDLETDSCVEAPGNDGAACVDEDPCTVTGVCSNGVCAPGQAVDCSFLDSVCGVGVCDPMLGCVAQALNDGAACDDQQFCTVDDTCTGGVCSGVPNTCAAPGDVCMIGSCNEANNTCIAVPGNDGAMCDDGNSCTTGEICGAGTCAGGVPANGGAACDDKNGCTSGTTCQGGVCTGATSTISQCIDGDDCCPPGCPADADCLYWVPGVQQNVPEASLTGWTECFQDTYDTFNGALVSQILQQCDKPNLLMGCRPPGSPTLALAAMAPRDEVLFDCGFEFDCTNQSNGVGWYFSDSYSWGFAQGGQPVQRQSCDTSDQSGELRMCWHTGGGFMNSGYRCGDQNMDTWNWERVVYEAD